MFRFIEAIKNWLCHLNDILLANSAQTGLDLIVIIM